MNAPSPADPINVTASTTEDKTTAIVAYLTLIGFIVAIIMHGSKKTRLGSYHLRQALGIMLTGIAGSVVMIIPILGWIAGPCLWIGAFVLWIFGLIAAANGQLKPAPLLGAHYQKWFGTAFD
ncbi:MAG: hypothetical protein ABIZ49_08975 [Opitutaceae bacterium]